MEDHEIESVIKQTIGFMDNAKFCNSCKYHSTKDEGFHHVCTIAKEVTGIPIVVSGHSTCDRHSPLSTGDDK